MLFNDRELLARMLQCEAGGEGEDGMRAVATVIMNRVHAADGEYARTGEGSLRNVLFQPYQFDCARTEIGEHTIPRTYTTCLRSRFIMILQTGRSRGIGLHRWERVCGITIPLRHSASRIFRATAPAISSTGSTSTASTRQPACIILLRKEHLS